MEDNRDLVFDELIKLAKGDNRYIFLCNDMDVFSLISFKEKFPTRVINVGVAEQNLINVAAGLASKGFIPVIYGILPFLVFRCFEQVKFNIDSMKLKVLIVGIGTGHSFSWDGPTHYGVSDLSLLSSLPNFVVSNPIDKTSINSSITKFREIKGKSMFLRLEKGKFKNINKRLNRNYGFRHIKFKKNSKKKQLIVTSGYLTQLYYNSELIKNFDIIDLVFLNEINEKKLNEFMKKYQKIIIADENYTNSSILDLIYKSLIGIPKNKIKIILPKNNQELFYASRLSILKKYKLLPEQLIKLNK